MNNKVDKGHDMEAHQVTHLEVCNDNASPVKEKGNVDTVHNDEALKVLTAYDGDPTWVPEQEKKVRMKIDRRLLPILAVTFGLQYYDKTMISQAAIFGLREDLQLTTGNRYSMSSGIFYFGFIAGAYPASQLAQRFPIERVAGGLILLWGLTFLLTAACFSWQAFYAQRFFLGFLEAGISPIFMLVIGQFYKKDEQSLMMGVWYAASGMITLFSPVLNYGLGHIHGTLSPWRYMYIVGGVITILWAVVVYLFMPPDPIRAKGFTERERYIAVARLRVNNSGVRNTHFKIEHVKELLLDEKFWLMFAQAFLILIASGPVNTFTPIIIESFGFGLLNTLLLLIPLGAAGAILILGASYTAYKVKNSRTLVMFFCELLVIMSCLILWRCESKGARLFAVYMLVAFSAAWAIGMGLSIANCAGYTKRVVSSSAVYVGYCLGSFAGPQFFKPQDAPGYDPGFIVVLGTSAASAGLCLIYRFVCTWHNKRRDQAGTLEAFDHAYEDDVTDRKNPQFRYVY